MLHDIHDGSMDQLVNVVALVKSPAGLVDTFLKAVLRTKMPLSLEILNTRYKEALKKIKSTAELAQVQG